MANQAIQSSLWPSLLRSDTSNPSHRVRRLIQVLASCLPAAALLAAITGIVTPLGLDDELVSVAGRTGTFEYVRDASPYSAGTSPRGIADFNRQCSGGGPPADGPVACPYTGDVVEQTVRNTSSVRWEFPYGLTSGIPDILREIFSSGTAGQATTVSNFFDIEWRQLSTAKSEYYDNGTEHAVGLYRQLDSFILQDEYKVLEGLVVDAKVGGIGFRNHTLPTGLARGGAWKEDLLFVEPEVSCVNTNITLDFEISTDFSNYEQIRNLVITDRGGFAGINTAYTAFDLAGAQSDAKLQARAYEAAFLNNAYTMMLYNITNPSDNRTGRAAFSYLDSEIGKTFPLNVTNRADYIALSLSYRFGRYLDPIRGLERYPNPYNITNGALGDINSVCAGPGDSALANISNVYVGCGLLQGAPVRVDGGPPSLFDNGSKWSSSLHACAATVRATIKTVSFAFNASSNVQGLGGLTVATIEPKVYASEDDYPLWGFEESGLEFNGVNPIWGLISPEYEARENVSSVRQPSFYIPGVSVGAAALGLPLSLNFANNLPGSDFPSRVMNQVFKLDKDWPYDLRGSASMSIFARWQALSSNATEASKVIRLLWTDLAASAVVGTKGALGRLNSGQKDEVVPVYISPFEHRITYNLFYGIPAFILLLFMAVVGFITVVLSWSGKTSVARLRYRIQQLSPGRIYTTYLFPQESSLTMASMEWRERNGSRVVKLGSTGTTDVPLGPESHPFLTGDASCSKGNDIDSSKPSSPH